MARRPQTIKQRIALDGGESLKRDLQQLGRDGEKAFALISRAARRSQGPFARFGKAMADVRRDLRRVGEAGRRVRGDIAGVGSSLGTVARRGSLAALAIGGVVTGLAAFVRGGTRAADEAIKTAQALGVSIEEFTGLQFAASQSGVEVERFKNGIAAFVEQVDRAAEESKRTGKELKKNLGDGLSPVVQFYKDSGVTVRRGLEDATKATTSAAKENETAFDKLGVEVLDANGQVKNHIQLLKEVATAFAGMEDGAVKTSIAMEFFTRRAGLDFIAFLNTGADGIDKLIEEARRGGQILTKTQGQTAEGFNDSISRLGADLKALQVRLSIPFAEALTPTITKITESLSGARSRIVAFGEVLATAITPIVIEFFNLFADGSNKASESLEELQASGLQERIKSWRDAIVDFGSSVNQTIENVVLPIFNTLREAVQLVADGINAVFGTNFSSADIVVGAVILKLVGGFSLLATTLTALIGTIKLLGLAFLVLGGGPLGIIVSAIALLVAGAALIVKNWESVGPIITGVFDVLKLAVKPLVDNFIDNVNRIFDVLTEIGKVMIAALTGDFDLVRSKISSLVSFIVGKVRTAINAIKELFSSSGDSGSSSSSSGGDAGIFSRFASGGRVRGPGTGTSDSILARLSDGEFVVRARAVREYGPALLHAINNLRLPKDLFRGFADGGMVQAMGRTMQNMVAVPMPIPAFADGGLADASSGPSGRPINISIGGETFAMVAESSVAEKLQRFANGRQLRAAGRKPSWYGAGR